MCYIRIRNPSDAIIFSQREKKRLEEKSPRKKSKISREGTDVAALRKSLLKKTTLEKKREVSRQIRFASKKKTDQNEKNVSRRSPAPSKQNKGAVLLFPLQF
jgi:hypothetical protein